VTFHNLCLYSEGKISFGRLSTDGRGKVKLSLCLTKYHAIKVYWGVELQLCAFLTVALGGGKWLASGPGHLTSGERGPGTHCTEGWVGPLSLSGCDEEEKFLALPEIALWLFIP